MISAIMRPATLALMPAPGRSFSGQSLPEVLNRLPFAHQPRPHKYYSDLAQGNKSGPDDSFTILDTNLVSRPALESFKVAAYETCRALKEDNVPLLKHMLEPVFFAHLSPALEFLRRDPGYSMNLHGAEEPHFDTRYLLKYERSAGLSRSRELNGRRDQYFRISIPSTVGGCRRYLYMRKRGLSVGLSQILQVDVPFSTSLYLSVDKKGAKESGRIQQYELRVWTFETQYKYRDSPFVFPRGYTFDSRLLKSRLFEEREPDSSVNEFARKIRGSEQFSKMRPKSRKAIMKRMGWTFGKEARERQELAKTKNVLKAVYFEGKEKEETERLRPALELEGWKIVDIDYTLGGNPLVAPLPVPERKRDTIFGC